MIPSAHNRLFNPGGCLTAQAVRSYINGSLRPGGRMQVEEHVKNCRLCAEALEGFKKHGRGKYLKSDVAFLSGRINRAYTRGNHQPDKRLSLLVLFSLIAFLFILLGVFYIFRQDMIHRKNEVTREHRDAIINSGSVTPDSSGRSPIPPSGDGK